MTAENDPEFYARKKERRPSTSGPRLNENERNREWGKLLFHFHIPIASLFHFSFSCSIFRCPAGVGRRAVLRMYKTGDFLARFECYYFKLRNGMCYMG